MIDSNVEFEKTVSGKKKVIPEIQKPIEKTPIPKSPNNKKEKIVGLVEELNATPTKKEVKQEVPITPQSKVQ